MESATVERVTEWDSVPFADGYAGLRELADREFTGAVSDGDAWLFVVNGRVVGVFDGSMEQFADADGTAYEAPHPALALLFAMQEMGGETRAKYYSEETPLSEVDSTLKSGNFTGYVELSENVLSGDYYTVYQGGKSMSVAFVGNNRRLVTGDEAFDRADDEVGIYEVRTVDVDVVSIPEPETAEETGTDASAAGGAAAGAAASGDQESQSAPDASAGESDPSSEPGQGGVTFGGDDPLAEDSPDATEATDDQRRPRSTGSADSTGSPEPTDEPERPSASTESDGEDPLDEPDDPLADPGESGNGEQSSATSPSGRGAERPTRESERSGQDDSQSPDSRRRRGQTPETDDDGDESVDGSVFDDESNWREARTIPALDPDESADPDAAGAAGAGGNQGGAGRRRSRRKTRSQQAQSPENEPDARSEPGRQRVQAADSTLEKLRNERDRLAARIEELEAEHGDLREERDRLAREREEAVDRVSALESKVADLQSTISSLEAQLEEANRDSAAGGQDEGGSAGRDVPVDRALEGTNLFVRYRRKSGATLDDAYDGTESREAVNENLRLEHHTDFDEADVVVDGEPFSEWLEGTIEYGFSRWIVQEFIHDVRETRNQSALEGLYEAIPEIDRIEFQGVVDVPTQEGSESRAFDVVLRDRMGDPLIVADLNDSREPATEAMLSSLVENATPVGEVEPGLAGAFFVTTSYYEPGALETAHEATGGGLLRRQKRKSLVKLSRKEGYHLCLVETRNGEFHLNVPEL